MYHTANLSCKVVTEVTKYLQRQQNEQRFEAVAKLPLHGETSCLWLQHGDRGEQISSVLEHPDPLPPSPHPPDEGQNCTGQKCTKHELVLLMFFVLKCLDDLL